MGDRRPDPNIIMMTYWLLNENSTKSSARKRRYWMAPLFKTRNDVLRPLISNENTGHFRNFMRMSVEDFQILIDMVGPKIGKKDTSFRCCISVKEQLAVTLRFLATGDSYASLQYLFHISKQSISKIIPRVCDALISSLKQYIKMPETAEEWLEIASGYERRWNFPNCIGAIDGKHIRIDCPINSGSDYYNYKGFFSIVLFAVVDANYNFIFADIGCQGRISDGGVFKNALISQYINDNLLNLPEATLLPGSLQKCPHVFISDRALPLTTKIMKPFGGFHSKNTKERIFNYRLSRARRVVENVFGIMSSVFRVLRKPLCLQPDKAQKIVFATVFLHNFLRASKTSNLLYTPVGSIDSDIMGHIVEGEWRANHETALNNFEPVGRPASALAKDVREDFANYFLNEGAVTWQNMYQ
ncbi:protein ANTAGONIST OF LIKE HETEROCHROMATIN PROTEIN 1-like [Ctenocephalides felis]|uniref:protein ANTAGONIST OF LIKE HETEROCHROMATIN PROTEIN 1-like n=1 Tax=Ctenocephalides felis TaxID=7515 RepID=UPI000E6E2861|nr:protein ANTAGONIST OF LIKE HETEROCHROMATIN PROTEIN 1-like [Ctenocephalides felis]XP_026476458.1 protein ANTAGONIST OF LIKE HETEROCHROMATIN PROTEIN 1-like [Ctenocephalides felis]